MAIMVYALVTYHWRAAAIRNKGSGPYDDRLGGYPIFLTWKHLLIAFFLIYRPYCPFRPPANCRSGQLHPAFPRQRQQLIISNLVSFF